MKALSLTQPWATLVAIGAKQWETRSWPTPFRGEVAIHASKKYPRACSDLEYESPFANALRMEETPLPLGKIIAIAEITDCEPTVRFHRACVVPAARCISISTEEMAFGDYSLNRYAFKIERVRRIKPIDCRGALGFWIVPDGVLSRIVYLDEVPA
jgi:activating signal cointegrator 1